VALVNSIGWKRADRQHRLCNGRALIARASRARWRSGIGRRQSRRGIQRIRFVPAGSCGVRCRRSSSCFGANGIPIRSSSCSFPSKCRLPYRRERAGKYSRVFFPNPAQYSFAWAWETSDSAARGVPLPSRFRPDVRIGVKSPRSPSPPSAPGTPSAPTRRH